MNPFQYFTNIKQDVLKQSLPGSYKQPFSGKTCIAFLVLGLANIAIGIYLTTLYAGLFTVNIPYQIGSTLTPFTIATQTRKPLFLYLEISDFYQSHFFYSKSVSINQLNGKATTSINSCKPLKYTNGKIIYPCGLIANTFNQDTFTVLKGTTLVPLNVKDISWMSVQERVKDTSYTLDQISAPPMWRPYESVPQLGSNRRFANWMVPASFSHFRKLYGKFDEGLGAGEYTMGIESDFPYGNKSVVLTESSWAGVRNYFLTVVMIISGVVMLLGGWTLWMKSDTFTY